MYSIDLLPIQVISVEGTIMEDIKSTCIIDNHEIRTIFVSRNHFHCSKYLPIISLVKIPRV